MEAGHKMDALIAEYVMGWEHRPDELYTIGESGTVFMIAVDTFDCCDGRHRVFTRSPWKGEADRWEPSSNISDAWSVIDEIRSWVGTDKDDLKDKNWVNAFWHQMLQLGMYTYCMPREVAAYTICRAALLAVREEE